MKNLLFLSLALFSSCASATGSPASKPHPAPALDFTVKYYNRVLTPEGVLRESRYEENVVRRPGHVWTARVLPPHAETEHDHDVHDHKHFNYVVVPRHVAFDGKQMSVEFVDLHERYVVNIEPTEYQNVGFDGSWANTYFVMDPAIVSRLPRSSRQSSTPNTHWLEIEKDGAFQRILWDEINMIPLVAETHDKKHSYYNRIDIHIRKTSQKALPWERLKGYAQRDYADFLD